MILNKKAGLVLSTIVLAMFLTGCSDLRDKKPSKMTKAEVTELKSSLTGEDEAIINKYKLGQVLRVFPANDDLSFNEIKKLVSDYEKSEEKKKK